MRPLASGVLLLALVPVLGSAQNFEQHRGQGYTFFAPGAFSGSGDRILHFGVGGEALVYKGVGVGGELGYVFPPGSFGSGAGLASVNASYHWNRQSHWLITPFVTGGYSLGFRSDVVNLVNFGAGINYWLGERAGLRLEFRDHIQPGDRRHFLEFRIGLAFR